MSHESHLVQNDVEQKSQFKLFFSDVGVTENSFTDAFVKNSSVVSLAIDFCSR